MIDMLPIIVYETVIGLVLLAYVINWKWEKVRHFCRLRLAHWSIINPPVKCPNCHGEKEAGHRYPCWTCNAKGWVRFGDLKNIEAKYPYNKIKPDQQPKPANYLSTI